MIVAAGLGSRLRPLTELRPKPALPVRGIPLVGYSLALLAAAGVTEVVINVHHLAERLIQVAESWCPAGVKLIFSREPELLHTGGAIRQVADFLRESDPCVIVGGDMILDADLPGIIARHQESGRAITAVLRRDPRGERFGTIGVDRSGLLRRVGRRFEMGDEVDSGIYTWANVLSRSSFDSLPECRVFNHLDDWWIPALAAGARDIGGEVLAPEQCVWEPVGTPAEYLAANFTPQPLSYLEADQRAADAGARISRERIIGAGAQVPEDADLRRVVVWDGESVPAGTVARDGVFAGGSFVPCATPAEENGAAPWKS
jgi:NDP-sugar pyrophosphorylase family protein